MLRLFEKKIVLDVKAKYLLLETNMRGMETKLQRFGEVVRGGKTVLWGLHPLPHLTRQSDAYNLNGA